MLIDIQDDKKAIAEKIFTALEQLMDVEIDEEDDKCVYKVREVLKALLNVMK